MVVTPHRSLVQDVFLFLMRAQMRLLLTPPPVSNCGISSVAAEAVRRRRCYMRAGCMPAILIAARQMALCWMSTMGTGSAYSMRIRHLDSLEISLCSHRTALLLQLTRLGRRRGALLEIALFSRRPWF